MFSIVVSILSHSKVLHSCIQHQVVGLSATRSKYYI